MVEYKVRSVKSFQKPTIVQDDIEKPLEGEYCHWFELTDMVVRDLSFLIGKVFHSEKHGDFVYDGTESPLKNTSRRYFKEKL